MADKLDYRLTLEEVRDVRAGPYQVGRDDETRVAHIYRLDLRRALCKRHFRAPFARLWDYWVGDRVCKACLRQYRKLAKQEASECPTTG